ncbi:hypothetical protein EV174_003587 [Coemansia sp. RSA 2320]|nr:hypothetical protein EV174_003587 [Coemansia sp. RSA 2320]
MPKASSANMTSFTRRQNIDPKDLFSTQSNIPDYVMISPDYVALAPSGPSGLSAPGLNNMLCLANRYRYDLNLPVLALDAQLVKFAQARADYLANISATVQNNVLVGVDDPPVFDTKVWKSVTQNLLKTTQNPTFAMWQFEGSGISNANMRDPNAMFFGAGKQGEYYVQVFGAPVNIKPFDRSVFPWCTSNQTFYNWVYPNDTPIPPKDKSNIFSYAFPYQSFEKISPVLIVPPKSGQDLGLVNGTKYYFSSPLGDVPYLKDLSIPNSVSPANSSPPFVATSGSGQQGMTKDELNLMTCLINSRRYSSCLPPVALNPMLIAAAQAHSYELNRAQNLSHFGAMGPPPMRIQRRGFTYQTMGENIVAGVYSAWDSFVMFSQSQGHLNNMLDPAFKYVGGGRSGQFWAVDFGTLLDGSQNPDPKAVPLCPGNSPAAIAIAFPNGLPSAPKLQTTACGNTQATSVKTPQYILTATTAKPTATSAPFTPMSPTQPTYIFTPPATQNQDGVVYVTVTIDTTVFIDEDLLLGQPTPTSSTSTPNQGGKAGNEAQTPTTSTTQPNDVYPLLNLGDSNFDVIMQPA